MEPFIGIIFYLTAMLAPQNATGIVVESENLLLQFTLQKGGAWKVESMKSTKIGDTSIEKGLFGIWSVSGENVELEVKGKLTTQKISALLDVPQNISWKSVTEIPVSSTLTMNKQASVKLERKGLTSIIFYRDKANILPEQISVKYEGMDNR
ncbi:MAG: hypothetical protein C0600_01130 [Ignavibacteria bacterium]|nr:MAG: hypothetical protein C0600_01130 [Ignavibacteria bacterium]